MASDEVLPVRTERASEDRVGGGLRLASRPSCWALAPQAWPCLSRGGGSLCVCSSGPVRAGLAGERRGVAGQQGNVRLKALLLTWEREESMAILAFVNDMHVVVRAGFPLCVLVCHVANVMVDF